MTHFREKSECTDVQQQVSKNVMKHFSKYQNFWSFQLTSRAGYIGPFTGLIMEKKEITGNLYNLVYFYNLHTIIYSQDIWDIETK